MAWAGLAACGIAPKAYEKRSNFSSELGLEMAIMLQTETFLQFGKWIVFLGGERVCALKGSSDFF